MLLPDREIPGKSARICAEPMPTADRTRSRSSGVRPSSAAMA